MGSLSISQTGKEGKQRLKKLTLVFGAGAFGGLANALAVWIFGAAGITAALGVSLAPALTPQLIYSRVVWGGLWGVIFLLPYAGRSVFLRGLLLSLGPSLVMLFVVFPLKLDKGVLGLALGSLTPLFVLLYNAVWGWAAALWLRLTEQPDLT